MPERVRKLLHLLELARPELLLAVTGNVWLMTVLAWRVEPVARRNPTLEQLGLPLSLLIGAVVACGLAGCGMALNDALDARHDRTFAPTRPIPAGRVNLRLAIAAAMAGLLGVLAAASLFGRDSLFLALLAGAGVVLYNISGRFVPSVGVVSLGLLHALTMAIPNPRLSFGWPIVLVLTHTMACAAVRHLLAGKRPRFSAADAVAICLGWGFWVMLGVHVIGRRGGGASGAEPLSSGIGFAPVLAVAGFVLTAAWVLRGDKRPGRALRVRATRFARLSTLWMLLYAAAWSVSVGAWGMAGVCVGLWLAGVLMVGVDAGTDAIGSGPIPRYHVVPIGRTTASLLRGNARRDITSSSTSRRR